MGLGKKKGSSRINRYEHQVTAVGFESLETLAKTLDVPVAYLLAESPEMADAILALTQVEQAHQAEVVEVLKKLGTDPALLDQLRALVQASETPGDSEG